MLVELFFRFVATVCFAVLFNVPRREFLWCGLAGMTSWLVVLLVGENMPVYFGIYVAACFVTLFARMLAGLRKMPVTVYIVPGIIPLVPGGSVYLTMYEIISGQQASAVTIGLSAMQTAGLICLGIVTVLSLPQAFFNGLYRLPNGNTN